MHTKLIKDLNVGDIVQISEPEGTARITAKKPSRLFHASGGCFRLDMRLESGPHQGHEVKDQHHPGDDAVGVP